MVNPYRSPSAADFKFETAERQGDVQQPLAGQHLRGERVVWWIALIAWFYPALLVSAFYGTWLMAWLLLGHMPRPSLDDPKHISVVVDIPYVFAGLLLVGFPAAAVVGVVVQFSFVQRSLLRRFLWFVTLLVLWISTIVFLRWDPLLVGQWYMD